MRAFSPPWRELFGGDSRGFGQGHRSDAAGRSKQSLGHALNGDVGCGFGFKCVPKPVRSNVKPVAAAWTLGLLGRSFSLSGNHGDPRR